ncbi:MAG: serine hydrolase [Rhodospirillales bacterium]
MTDSQQDEMDLPRRWFLGGAAALASVPLALTAAKASETETSTDDVAQRILGLFAKLPGDISLKVFAPPCNGGPALRVNLAPARRMFVGSAIKTFVLAEALRQADGPDVVQKITQRQLALNASVWSLDSATFNPPELSGLVSERTTLEAMIMHSDNTGTDMSLKLVGPDRVRAFIAAAGLSSTQIPDSTRSFFGYLLGAPDYKTFTWAQIVAAANDPIVNSPLNNTETLASSANDFVSYYAHALQGGFFRNKETLDEFRRILSLGDAIWLVPLPLGVSAFVKGGSIDVPGFHALCVPGGMLVASRWVYFCFTINWYASAETDPGTVAAFAAATSRALKIVKQKLSG